jgi:hypothetical protein
LTGAALAWDDAFRALDQGLWAARGAVVLVLISPLFLFFAAAVWMLATLLLFAGWIVWGIGLWRVRRVVGSARARREFGAALLVLLLVPQSGFGLFIQTTEAGGLMTVGAVAVLFVLTLSMTAGALGRLAAEEGVSLPVERRSEAGSTSWWGLIVVGAFLMAIAALLPPLAGLFLVIAVPIVLIVLVFIYLKRVNRCRELIWRLRGAGRRRRR